MKRKKTAFTLMEVVLILFIVSVGLMAAISLILRSLYFHNIEKDLLTASFLTYEGTEIMINIRDTNVMLGNYYDAWDGISAGIAEKNFRVEPFKAEEVENIDEALLQRNPNGFFVHDPVQENTKFRRMITTKAETTASTSVEVLINWYDRGNEYNYKIETVLYDPSF